MSIFSHVLSTLNNWVWGLPLLTLIIGVGLYFTICTRCLQLRYFWYAHKIAFTRQGGKAKGEISHFCSLMTAMASTMGVGSITGVATAISLGGMGSIFWMWVAAFFGMIIKYGEAILAVKYRSSDATCATRGGPMYYLERGLHMKWLAVSFAIFGLFASFGIGNIVQVNSIVLAVQKWLHLPTIWVGLALVICVGCSIIGGIKGIGRVVVILVPVMAIFYIAVGLGIIFLHWRCLPSVCIAIVKGAFSKQATLGGFAGATVMKMIQIGISRGIFSSEAGMGSSSIAAAAAKTDIPARQGLISMCSASITTGVVCTITGFVIAVSGVFGNSLSERPLLDGSMLALQAFDQSISYGGALLTVALIAFAYSTIIGWAYCGEKCVEYLFLRGQSIMIYRFFFTLLVFFGSFLSVEFVWDFSNLMNGLMAFPNLIGISLLGHVVLKETDLFEQLFKRERRDKKLKV